MGVSKKDLLTFETEWDGGDNIYIEIPQLITEVIEKKIPNLSFMSEFYPNPAGNETNMKFGLEKPAEINISLFDLKANVVEVIAKGYKSAGEYDLKINLSDLTPGIYFCKLKIENVNIIVRKLQIVK